MLGRVTMRDFDHARARGQVLDQGVGGGAVLGIEIGVPFIQQIDRRIGAFDDLLERAQLLFAGGISLALSALGLGFFRVLSFSGIGLFRGEFEGEPIRGWPPPPPLLPRISPGTLKIETVSLTRRPPVAGG